MTQAKAKTGEASRQIATRDGATTTVADLATLATQINAKHQACEAAVRNGLARAVEAGELLLQAKAAIPHGEWLHWLRDNTAIPARTAQAYTKLAEAERGGAFKCATVAHLGMREALRLIAAEPKEGRPKATTGSAGAPRTTQCPPAMELTNGCGRRMNAEENARHHAKFQRPAEKTVTTSPAVTDCVGNVIEQEHVQDAFRAADRFDELTQRVIQLKKDLHLLANGPAGKFLDDDVEDVDLWCGNLHTLITRNRPFRLCDCEGRKCADCRQVGWRPRGGKWGVGWKPTTAEAKR